MASRRPQRYLETFLDPVASFSQSMSPYRSTATPFIPKITQKHTVLYEISAFLVKIHGHRGPKGPALGPPVAMYFHKKRRCFT